jgi:hypothetical protein
MALPPVKARHRFPGHTICAEEHPSRDNLAIDIVVQVDFEEGKIMAKRRKRMAAARRKKGVGVRPAPKKRR